jgi:hypothetical protein
MSLSSQLACSCSDVSSFVPLIDTESIGVMLGAVFLSFLSVFAIYRFPREARLIAIWMIATVSAILWMGCSRENSLPIVRTLPAKSAESADVRITCAHASSWQHSCRNMDVALFMLHEAERCSYRVFFTGFANSIEVV